MTENHKKMMKHEIYIRMLAALLRNHKHKEVTLGPNIIIFCLSQNQPYDPQLKLVNFYILEYYAVQ